MARKKIRTTRYNNAGLLKDPLDVAACLEAALEDGDHRALSPDGNPELGTVLKVVRALGLRLHAAPVNPSSR